MNTESQTRLQEILGLLAAYRAGWISYDRTYVAQLQHERIALEARAALVQS